MCLGVASVCLFGAARAQTPSDAESPAGDPRFYGGARLSVTMSDVSSVQEHDPRFGVGGGLFVAGTVWKSFDLRVEANYVQKGARLAFSRSAIEWQMDYLEIPVLLVWNIIPKSKTSVELYGGMSYGIPVQQQVEQGENLGYDIEDFTEQPIFINQNTVLQINDVEDTDLGFALGIGLSVPVGQVNFLVDARLTRSITDPVVAADFVTTIGEDEEAVTTTTVTDFSNRLFSFYIGFSFPFGARAPAGSE